MIPLYEPLYEPGFVHDYVWDTLLNEHTFKGSRIRHIVFERVIRLFQDIAEWIGDASPFYPYIDALIIIAYGINCNFPLKDVAQYVIWHFKGYP